MPLPDADVPWPPTVWQPIQRDVAEASVWYGGDPECLADFYSGSDKTPPKSIADRVMFWRKRMDPSADQPKRLHLPVAAQIAMTSADLLFSEPPTFTIPAAHDQNPNPDAEETEKRLLELAELDGWASTLLVGAEVNSALGDVYLRALWDESVADHPMMDVVHADHAVPEFSISSQLTAVTFWRTVMTSASGEVWRHLERHEYGAVLHGLYKGNRQTLGKRIPLTAHPSTEGLAEAVLLPNDVKAFGTGIDVRHVPNVKPNRQRRDHPFGYAIGRSDFQGLYGLMDALDETWSAWMRDIDLGKGRLVVPDQFLTRAGAGEGATFDMDQRVFSPLNVDPQHLDKAGITAVQFAIRTEEHARTAQDLFDRIVVGAGYSPQSFGEKGNGAQMTATEVDARSDESDRTTSKKRSYFTRALEDLAYIALVIDRDIFGSPVTPMRPRLAFLDAAQTDLRDRASALNLINLAQAASVETKVRLLHPEWDDQQVTAEADAIKIEQGLNVTDPTGGAPATFGG